ncbi:MAG: threonine/serine dehydratase, partial [Acidobacteriota bacterium]
MSARSEHSPDAVAPPAPEAIADARRQLGDRVRTTPLWRWRGREIDDARPAPAETWLKLELFQFAGTFKPRGALLHADRLDDDARARGVTAVSAGNHA